jgi:peptidoglycan/xylan/chitin deacetylase (PgdA/CDA1 family)
MSYPGDPRLSRADPVRRSVRRTRVRRRRAIALGVIGTVVILIVALVANSRSSQRVTPAIKQAPIKLRRHGPPPSLLARENAAINRLLARQPFINTGGGERREIALTFDDGPGPYTPRLLDQLQRLHAPATFFEIGFMIHYFSSSLGRELTLGDAIGDHTETHPMMAELSPTGQRDQIIAQTRQLARHGAPFPRLYRPPYGSFNRATFRILHRLHMIMVLWTVDTSDYLQPGVATIVHRVLAGAKPGAIILMHDAGGTRTQEIAALPAIVRGLRARRYKLVTIPQLILQDPPLHKQATPGSLSGD